tara:strand:- start:864 stop:1583 length:720 start_codon:yes stop_codon:yes gene_type:complete
MIKPQGAQLNLRQIDSSFESVLENIDPKSGVDLCNFYDVKPNKYYCFKTGGPHFFNRCKNKEVIRKEFTEMIWPFIYHTEGQKTRIMTGTISKTKAGMGYPLLKLKHKSDSHTRTDYRQLLYDKKIEVIREMEKGIHRIVAECFVPNDDPKNKTVVDHINGNRVDYRVENLRWATLSENSVGNRGQYSDPDEVYKVVNEQLWFHENGNEFKGNKNNHKESKQHKQLSLLENFENNLPKK